MTRTFYNHDAGTRQLRGHQLGGSGIHHPIFAAPNQQCRNALDLRQHGLELSHIRAPGVNNFTACSKTPRRTNGRIYPSSVSLLTSPGLPHIRRTKYLWNGCAARASFGNRDAIFRFRSSATRFHPILDHGFAGETSTRLRTREGANPASIKAVAPPYELPTRSQERISAASMNASNRRAAPIRRQSKSARHSENPAPAMSGA